MVASRTPENAVARAFPTLYALGLITVEPPPVDVVALTRRECSRNIQREIRAERREKGLCMKCGGERAPGITLCEKHRAQSVEATRKSRGSLLCSRV